MNATVLKTSTERKMMRCTLEHAADAKCEPSAGSPAVPTLMTLVVVLPANRMLLVCAAQT